jgi:hypothetical protein
MPEPRQRVTELLESALAELGALADDMTLVGGCLAPLLITDPAAPPPRVTVDVDLVVEAVTYRAYDQLSQAVRARGFHQGTVVDDPVCRFRKANIIIDLLPTDPRVLGFGNRWHSVAAATATKYVLPSGRELRHATAPCFLATKIVAFRDRGSGDYFASQDFEDIVAVVDGRPALPVELAAAPEELRSWVRSELAAMVGERGFLDSLPGMILGHGEVTGRVSLVLARFKSLTSNDDS